MTEIPENNLPIYLQNYTVSILSGNEKSGTVDYTTVGIIPSNVSGKKVWNFKVSGTLQPQTDEYIFLFDFQNVNYDAKISFEDKISGSLNICGRVLDISKNGYFTYSSKFKTLSIILSKQRWGFLLKRESKFSLNVEINDTVQIQQTYFFKLCQQKKEILSSPNNIFSFLNFTLKCIPQNLCPCPTNSPCTPCPINTLSPCPTTTPSTSCQTPIPNSCFQTFTNGITFNYFEEFESNTIAIVSTYIPGVGSVEIPNSCYNTVETSFYYTNTSGLWNFEPYYTPSNQYVMGPIVYLNFFSPDAFVNNVIAFENVNFGPFTVLHIEFSDEFDVSELPDYTIIINNQNLYVLDNVFSILNNVLPLTLPYYININQENQSTYLEAIKPYVYLYTESQNSKGKYIQKIKASQKGYYLYDTQNSKEYLFTIVTQVCPNSVTLKLDWNGTINLLYPTGQTPQSIEIVNTRESVYFAKVQTSPSIYIYYWPVKNINGNISYFFYIFASEPISTSQEIIPYLTYDSLFVPYPTIQGCVDYEVGKIPTPTPFPTIPTSTCPPIQNSTS